MHVSVAGIDVYSGRSGAGGYEKQGTTTLHSRFEELCLFDGAGTVELIL